MDSIAPKSSSSTNTKTNSIYNFVDTIKNSVASGSTKVSDMVNSNKSPLDNTSPLLLTEDLQRISLTPPKKSSLLVPGETLSIDNTGSASSILGSSSNSKNSWLTVGKTSRIGIKVLLVVLLLGFVGINIFVYLGFSVKNIYGLLDKFVNTIKAYLSGNKSTPKPKPNTKPKPKPKEESLPSKDPVTKTIQDLVDDIEEPKPPREKKGEVKPDEDRTSIHSSGKSGYCNVGSWKGIRSCVKVAKESECISGDIFPTKDICINPNLRH